MALSHTHNLTALLRQRAQPVAEARTRAPLERGTHFLYIAADISTNRTDFIPTKVVASLLDNVLVVQYQMERSANGIRFYRTPYQSEPFNTIRILSSPNKGGTRYDYNLEHIQMGTQSESSVTLPKGYDEWTETNTLVEMAAFTIRKAQNMEQKYQ